jgi:hypothetical protein
VPDCNAARPGSALISIRQTVGMRLLDLAMISQAHHREHVSSENLLAIALRFR